MNEQQLNVDQGSCFVGPLENDIVIVQQYLANQQRDDKTKDSPFQDQEGHGMRDRFVSEGRLDDREQFLNHERLIDKEQGLNAEPVNDRIEEPPANKESGCQQ